MSTCVEIRLLGPLSVIETSRGQVASRPLPRSANARRLLVTLSLEPGPHPRSELIERLWPGTDLSDDRVNSSARERLKKEVANARACLGGARSQIKVDSGFDTVELHREQHLLEVDVMQERIVRHSNDVDRALTLHRGVLLQGWTEPWLDNYRETQRSVIGRLLASKHELKEPLLSQAVDLLLQHGGQAWLSDSSELLRGLRSSSEQTIERLVAALSALQPPTPVFPASIDQTDGHRVHLTLGAVAAPNDRRLSRVPLDESAVNRLPTDATPAAVIRAALGLDPFAADDDVELFGPSTDVAGIGTVHTRRQFKLDRSLITHSRVLVIGESAAGKTVSARQAGMRLFREGWSVLYVDAGVAGSGIGELAYTLIRMERRPAARHLTIVDNLQANAGLARDVCRLLSSSASSVPDVLLALTWPSAAELARSLMPDCIVLSWTGHEALAEIATGILGPAANPELITAVGKLAAGDLSIARLAMDFYARSRRLPRIEELAQAAFDSRVQGQPLSEDAVALLYEVSALGEFEISPTKAYVETRNEVAARELTAIDGIRADRGHYVVGHRTIATLTAAYIASRRKELAPPIRLAIDYLSEAADDQVLVMLQRLDLSQLQHTSSADQHGSAYLARAWDSTRVLSLHVTNQSRLDPTWGNNTASAIFAAETLARFDRQSWEGVASFVRSRWILDGDLPSSVGRPPAERVDFDEIAKRMTEEDEDFGTLPPYAEPANTVDFDRMHRTWVLGLLLGFEAHAVRQDPDRRNALIQAATLAASAEGYFYPKRVPWVTARVLLGLAAAGESVTTSPIVREGTNWLMRPHPEGPCRFGVWESGTGTWNSSVMTTTMCLMALLRCGIPPDTPIVTAGLAYIESQRAAWQSPGREIDAADALETHLLTGGHWVSAKRELRQLLDWARDSEPWIRATELASVSQDEGSKVPELASSLVRIVWEILRLEMPVLLEGVAMEIASRLNGASRT